MIKRRDHDVLEYGVDEGSPEGAACQLMNFPLT